MRQMLSSAARASAVAAITLSLAACGPDDSAAPTLGHLAIADSESPVGYTDDVFTALRQALPMLANGAQNFGLAPPWDYARDSYADYAPDSPYETADYAQHSNAGYCDNSAAAGQYGALALANLIAGVIGDSPPDYGFNHSGVEPWAWQTGDGFVRYVEHIQGGQRYYYYKPNATRPLLVRDPYYSYGYREDRLMEIYDRDGRVLSARGATRQRLAAQWYLDRARQLHSAALTDRRHGISARQWEQRRLTLAADRRTLAEARQERGAWRHWEQQHKSGLDSRWQSEWSLRAQSAARFARWQKASFSSPAPHFYEADRRAEALRVAQQVRKVRADEARLANVAKPQREAREHVLAQRRADRRTQTRPDLVTKQRENVQQVALAKQRREIRREANERHRADAAKSQRQREIITRRAAAQHASRAQARHVMEAQAAAQLAKLEAAEARKKAVLARQNEAARELVSVKARAQTAQRRAVAIRKGRQQPAVRARATQQVSSARRPAARKQAVRPVSQAPAAPLVAAKARMSGAAKEMIRRPSDGAKPARVKRNKNLG